MLSAYRHTLRHPQLRFALVLGVLLRTPVAASFLAITLHVVGHLGASYTSAGLLSTVATVGVAVAGPWRGRLLDRIGLRRTLLPSIVVLTVCWSVAPFVGYLPLLVLAGVASLFVVPVFSIVRQMILAAVPEEERRSALSLDAMGTELAFMAGPAFAAWACTTWDTRWVLFGIQMVVAVGCVAVWLMDPPLRPADDEAEGDPVPLRAWMGVAAVAVLAATAAATIVIAGTDVSIVAAARGWGTPQVVGPILVVWAGASLVGGFVYGSLHREIRVFWILGALAVVTIPAVLAQGPWTLAGLMVLAGLVCAPTLTATTEALTRVVPLQARGEAMGWHGSSMNVGAALGAPLAGVAIDHLSPTAGFAAVGLVGLLIAVAGALAQTARRRRASVEG